jgi:hypothetical protein
LYNQFAGTNVIAGVGEVLLDDRQVNDSAFVPSLTTENEVKAIVVYGVF